MFEAAELFEVADGGKRGCTGQIGGYRASARLFVSVLALELLAYRPMNDIVLAARSILVLCVCSGR